jgi:hypothetical protein
MAIYRGRKSGAGWESRRATGGSVTSAAFAGAAYASLGFNSLPVFSVHYHEHTAGACLGCAGTCRGGGGACSCGCGCRPGPKTLSRQRGCFPPPAPPARPAPRPLPQYRDASMPRADAPRLGNLVRPAAKPTLSRAPAAVRLAAVGSRAEPVGRLTRVPRAPGAALASTLPFSPNLTLPVTRTAPHPIPAQPRRPTPPRPAAPSSTTQRRLRAAAR